MDQVTFDISIANASVSVHTNVQDRGADLLFLVHGLGCSADSFRDVWTAPGYEDVSIVAVDLPGFGRSLAPEGFSYSMEDQARVCAGLIAKFPSKHIHFVGHSMGGAIGLLLPSSVLESLTSFINVEGNLNPEDCIFGSRTAATATLDQFAKEILPEFKSSSTIWCQNGLDIVSPQVFYKSAKSLVEWSDNGELLRKFRELKIPKVYIYGEENAEHSTVASVAGIEQIIIPVAGHFVMNDNPAGFYSKMLVGVLRSNTIR